MQELIKKLQDEHGISTEKSQEILNTVSNFLTGKFPMIDGAWDSVFTGKDEAEVVTDTASTNLSTTETQADDGGLLGKISGFVPDGMKDKVEQFAKQMFGK